MTALSGSIQILGKTYAQLAALGAPFIPLANQWVYITDQKRYAMGDGVTAFTSLPTHPLIECSWYDDGTDIRVKTGKMITGPSGRSKSYMEITDSIIGFHNDSGAALELNKYSLGGLIWSTDNFAGTKSFFQMETDDSVWSTGNGRAGIYMNKYGNRDIILTTDDLNFQKNYFVVDNNEVRMQSVGTYGGTIGVENNLAYLDHTQKIRMRTPGGTFEIASGGGYYAQLFTTNLSTDRQFQFPNASGTIALTSNLTSYVPYTGATNVLFTGGNGIDVVATAGTDILNIGTSAGDIINIGYAGSTINIQGTLAYQNVTNWTVTDKLITLNKGGALASGVSTGFEIEENASITGWLTTSGTRDGWELKAPAAFLATFSMSSLSQARTYTLPDASGTFALTADLSSYTPTARTLTINGTSYDLSANRSWAVGDAMVSGKLSQFAATTSAELAGVISDETGTGSLVFAQSPTFAGTPILATPTMTSGALTGTGGNGFFELIAQSANPSAPSGTGLRLFSNLTGAFGWVRKNGTDTYVRQFASTLTSDRTYTLPDTSDTFAMLAATQTFTNKRITTRTVTAADATSITPNTDNADVTMQTNTQGAGTLTINADTGTPTNNQQWTLIIRPTNAQTLSWNALYIAMGCPLPTTANAGKRLIVRFLYDTGTSKWGCLTFNQEA